MVRPKTVIFFLGKERWGSTPHPGPYQYADVAQLEEHQKHRFHLLPSNGTTENGYRNLNGWLQVRVLSSAQISRGSPEEEAPVSDCSQKALPVMVRMRNVIYMKAGKRWFESTSLDCFE